MMKEILIAATAFALTGGVAFAQSSLSDVDQTGQNGVASITQIAPLGSNDSQLTQGGTNNETTIRQEATIDNQSTVEQTGASNRTFVDQINGDNYSLVTQSGTNNLIDTDQSGTKGANSSIIWQDDTFSSTAKVNQQDSANFDSAKSNGSDIYQSGTNQLSEVTQTMSGEGGYNWSDIEQSGGDGNTAQVTQTITEAASMNTSYVTQNGSGNMATVNQSNGLQ